MKRVKTIKKMQFNWFYSKHLIIPMLFVSLSFLALTPPDL